MTNVPKVGQAMLGTQGHARDLRKAQTIGKTPARNGKTSA
jgi:hypothetical protein